MIGLASAIRSGIADWSATDRSLLAAAGGFLTADGDSRIAISESDDRNVYGCSPYPKSSVIDFASSTASSISGEAFARLQIVHEQLKAQSAYLGVKRTFSTATEDARTELATLLKLPRKTDVIFAASGTDAQLIALCLARLGSNAPISTVVVGSDQTGSGSVFAAAGCHFSTRTAQGAVVKRGGTIEGMENARYRPVPFLKGDGAFRTLAEMDAAVIEAVESEIGAGRRVLLQAMDASKFGWRAPSDACLTFLREKWRSRVQIAIDACQLRLPRSRLRTLLENQYMVLITGSKFFTGPAFSGALFIPPFWVGRIQGTIEPPHGLRDYSSIYDWPTGWNGIRSNLPDRPCVGQWLRWQAALEEMKLYFAVPGSVRRDIAAALASTLERAVEASAALQALPLQPVGQSKKGQSIFSFLPANGHKTLPAQASASIYRSLQNPVPSVSAGIKDFRPCHIGQPVALASFQAAALRLSISARTVRTVWSPNAAVTRSNLARQYLDVSTVISRLEEEISNVGGLENGIAI